MTTTIRPWGPEAGLPGGGTGRDYTICVNGRTVGSLSVAAAARALPGPRVGGISRLVIDQRDRGRGRATVAALAAEEVLRSWDCARIDVRVPTGTHEAAGLALARTLGYTPRARNMAKALPDRPPELPDGSVGRPMRVDEFDRWFAAVERQHMDQLIAGGSTPEGARATSDATWAELLPRGLDSPATSVLRLEAGADATRPVGTVWLGPGHGAPADGGDPIPWVFDVEVEEVFRGLGHGRSLMLLAEGEAMARGATRLALNVFADNTRANALYDSLGYTTFLHVLQKQL